MSKVILGGKELELTTPRLGLVLRLGTLWGGDRSRILAMGYAALALCWPSGEGIPPSPCVRAAAHGHDLMEISDQAIEELLKRKLRKGEIDTAAMVAFDLVVGLLPQEREVEEAAGNSAAQTGP